MNRLRKKVIPCLAALVAGSASVAGQSAPPPVAGASLEDLMKIDVTSVSRKEQSLARTGAAVFVMGPEDIRRSGAANIPDLLRMAPGVEVAQINANQWAISVRGFNAAFSNKVLVLVDGRSAYVDNFSGVYWDQIDTPLEDIERIEVIRGPGGTVWGANAVNGVINIITKSAADTKGGLVTAGSGTRQSVNGLVQYGGDAGSRGAYRIFAKYLNTEKSSLPGGRFAPDNWNTAHAGFRFDRSLTRRDTLSVQGDYLDGDGGATSQIVSGNPPVASAWNNVLKNRSGDILARWEHTMSTGSSASLQVYDTYLRRRQDGVLVTDNTFDVEFEQHVSPGRRHDLVWGLDFRQTGWRFRPLTDTSLTVNPAAANDNLYAVFGQDEMRLARNLYLTAGIKVEHNAYTGFEYQPGAQLVWAHDQRHSLWFSADRAIRQPDPLEHQVEYGFTVLPVPGAGNALLLLKGNPLLRAEKLTAFEAGYRTQASDRIWLDLTAFNNLYYDLTTTEPGLPAVSFTPAGPRLTVPLVYANLAHAANYGVEASVSWQASRRWKLSPSYSALHMSVKRDPAGNDPSIQSNSGDSPKQQAQFRSLFSLSRSLELDSSLKYTAALDSFAIPAYTRLDIRLGWRATESTEFSLVGQNLSSSRHFEFFDRTFLFGPAQTGRGISGKLTWHF